MAEYQTMQESLLEAIRKGDLNIVKFCLQNGANINLKDMEANETPLHFAACYSKLEIVKILLQNGADINAKDSHGDSPLHKAVLLIGLEITKFLLQNGADINAKNNFGSSPLHEAVTFENIEVVKFLVQKGARLDLKDMENRTPLEHAVSMRLYDIVKYLKNPKQLHAPDVDILAQDYYSILGVQKDTLLTKELKRGMKHVYHKLSLKYHPDKSKAEDAMEKFKRIKTAFEVLNDPQKKRAYDQSGEEGLKRKYFD